MDIPVEILTGKIDPDWATEIGRNGFDVWRQNHTNSEELLRDVPLDRLGGLIVCFGTGVVLPKEIEAIRAAHSAVDLVNSEPRVGLVTNTKNLLSASLMQNGRSDPLTEALQTRSIPNSRLGHGGNEKWFFPVVALELGITYNYEFLQ
jgi:hypothetical protein